MEEQIGKLYEELSGYLITVIRGRLFAGCPDDYVYDCLHDVFEIALRKKDDPRFMSNPRGWLIVTAKFVVDNFNRKTVKRLTHYQQDCIMEWIPDCHDMLESISYKIAMENDVLSQAKARLSEQERLLFVMRYEENMDTREIAQKLQLKLAFVRTKLTRIKHKVENYVYEHVG